MRNLKFPKLLLIFMSLAYLSCEKQQQNEIVEESSKELNFQRKPFHEYSGLPELFQETISEKSNLVSKKGNNSKLKVDFSSVTKVNVGEDVFYTFKVLNNDKKTTTFQNLVICDYSERETDAYLTIYEPDLSYFERVNNDAHTYFTGYGGILKLNAKTSSTAKSSCFTVTEFACDYGGSTHSAGANCTQVYTRSYTFCPPPSPPGVNEIQGPGGSWGPDYGDGSGGGGSGNNGRVDDQGFTAEQIANINIMTEPLSNINLHIYAINKLGLSYNSAESKWLKKSHHKHKLVDLIAFLEEQNYSSSAKKSVKEFINKISKSRKSVVERLSSYSFDRKTYEVKKFEQDYRGRMSKSEEKIFDGLPRDKQLDYLHNGYLAQEYAKILYSANELYNGKGDAYRHALWNALATSKMGATLTKNLTDAHESRPHRYNYENKENDMDLFNNRAGRIIGGKSMFMLMVKVKSESDQGKLRYLNNLNSSNNQATISSTLIPTNK